MGIIPFLGLLLFGLLGRLMGQQNFLLGFLKAIPDPLFQLSLIPVSLSLRIRAVHVWQATSRDPNYCETWGQIFYKGTLHCQAASPTVEAAPFLMFLSLAPIFLRWCKTSPFAISSSPHLTKSDLPFCFPHHGYIGALNISAQYKRALKPDTSRGHIAFKIGYVHQHLLIIKVVLVCILSFFAAYWRSNFFTL